MIAEAWISVSRSGHWTRLSSAQQEAKKPRDAAALAALGRAASLGARRRSRSPWPRCLRSRSSARRARRLILSGAASSAPRRRRATAPALELGLGLGRAGSTGRVLELLQVDAVLGELGLEHVGGLGHLGVVLGARLARRAGLDALASDCAWRLRRCSAFRCARVFATLAG